MADRSDRGKEHVDQDGVRTIEGSGIRASVWLLALAVALVGLAVFVVFRPTLERAWSRPSEPPAADRSANVAAANSAAKLPSPPGAAPPAREEPPRLPEAQRQSTPAAAPAVPPAPAPTASAAAVAAQLEEDSEPAPDADSEDTNNEPTGIALFPPPGTKPIKRGIVVPEGVELPPGYVRHYQTTDDGRQLPPILMFHPDYQPLDERGDPIPIPDDRVVPPQMAPAGIPIEMLQVPETATPAMGGSARGRGGRED